METTNELTIKQPEGRVCPKCGSGVRWNGTHGVCLSCGASFEPIALLELQLWRDRSPSSRTGDAFVVEAKIRSYGLDSRMRVAVMDTLPIIQAPGETVDEATFAHVVCLALPEFADRIARLLSDAFTMGG